MRGLTDGAVAWFQHRVREKPEILGNYERFLRNAGDAAIARLVDHLNLTKAGFRPGPERLTP